MSGLSLFAFLGSTLWHCEVKIVELVDLGPYDSANVTISRSVVMVS